MKPGKKVDSTFIKTYIKKEEYTHTHITFRETENIKTNEKQKLILMNPIKIQYIIIMFQIKCKTTIYRAQSYFPSCYNNLHFLFCFYLWFFVYLRLCMRYATL